MKHVPPDEPPQLARRGEPGRIRAIILAVVVHAAFFALIVFGVTWQVKPTPPVQAELWSQLPPAKSEPKPEPPKPEPPKPEPPKPEPPKPEPPKPEPVKPEPPKPEPVKPEPPRPDPEIALKAEREKKERERRQKLEDEKREKEKRERAEKQKQEDEKKKREQEEAAKKKREQDEAAAKKKREDDKRRAEEDATRKEAERQREAAASARQTEFNKYVDGIKNKIRGKANVPDSVTGNPAVTFRIRILPGGEVLEIQITKRSGNPAYDAAIERAIRSASPLPVPPANSELFQQFRDLNLQIQHER